MKSVTGVAAVVFSTVAFASMPIPTTIEELAKGADHILIGHVVGVDMLDEKGRQIDDEYGRTGPGLKNTIRLHIMVDEVLVTNSPEPIPQLLKVPLDPFMHYSLGQVRSAHAKPSGQVLVLLKGAEFLPVVPGAVLRSTDEKETALRIHAESHQPASTTAPATKTPGESKPKEQ